MTDPKIIEAAAEEYVTEVMPLLFIEMDAAQITYNDEMLCIIADDSFKAGYAKASEDMVPMEVVERLVEALKTSLSGHGLSASLISKANIEIHGDLIGCDCEGGCVCKPESWCALEEIKYHSLGSEICIEEALAEFKTWEARRE